MCVWPGGPSDRPSPRQPGGQCSCYDNPACHHNIMGRHVTSAVKMRISHVKLRQCERCVWVCKCVCDQHTLLYISATETVRQLQITAVLL